MAHQVSVARPAPTTARISATAAPVDPHQTREPSQRPRGRHRPRPVPGIAAVALPAAPAWSPHRRAVVPRSTCRAWLGTCFSSQLSGLPCRAEVARRYLTPCLAGFTGAVGLANVLVGRLDTRSACASRRAVSKENGSLLALVR